MQLIDTSKSLLENLYYVSGILILITVVIGIIQISLTKKISQTNSRREAALLSLKQIELYTTQIMPLISKIDFDIPSTTDIRAYELKEFCRNELQKKFTKDQFENRLIKSLAQSAELVTAMNAIDTFAICFVNELADEKIAFSSIGLSFVLTVESLYFDLSISVHDNSNFFENVLKLYDIWSKKLIKLQTALN